MKRKTLVILQVLGWFALVPFFLVGAFAFVVGSVLLAPKIWACGLPGLAAVIFTRKRLRRLHDAEVTPRGFEPVLLRGD